MILLDRKTPRKILTLEALLRRLDPNDSNYSFFQESLVRLKYGYDGEQRVDREWIEMPYLGEHFLLFNCEFESEFNTPHQIDTLLFTKNFVLILEVKNIVGRVDYNEKTHQFLRKRQNGESESLTNPFDQLRRHIEFVDRQITKFKIPVPIVGAVVMANPSTIIGTVPETYPIFHASGLRTFIRNLKTKYSSEITSHQLEKLSKYFLSLHKPMNYDLNISLDRIRKGVLCEKCNAQMGYKNGIWACVKCDFRSRIAIYQGLHDYQLLISNKISNQEFRDFFNIKSMYAASKILSRLNFEYEGKTKSRNYIIPNDIISRFNGRF